jgi:hypothetical protein
MTGHWELESAVKKRRVLQIPSEYNAGSETLVVGTYGKAKPFQKSLGSQRMSMSIAAALNAKSKLP